MKYAKFFIIPLAIALLAFSACSIAVDDYADGTPLVLTHPSINPSQDPYKDTILYVYEDITWDYVQKLENEGYNLAIINFIVIRGNASKIEAGVFKKFENLIYVSLDGIWKINGEDISSPEDASKKLLGDGYSAARVK